MTWQQFLNSGWVHTSALNGFTEEGQCPSMAPLRAIGDVSLADGVAAMLAEPDRHLLAIAWIAMQVLHMLPARERAAVLDTLVTVDPVRACAVYLRNPDLTKAEIQRLYGGFSPHMPLMKRKIDLGRVKRVRSS